LEVPAKLLGLEGVIVDGMSFALFGGRATWDKAGKIANPQGASEPKAAGREDLITNSIGKKLARIPAGKFTMGSPPNEPGRVNGEDLHEVEITKPFAMGVHHVTVAQFRQFVAASAYKTEAEKAADPQTWQQPGFTTADHSPVVYVSWNDAVAFC